jgi:hypothetical protein
MSAGVVGSSISARADDVDDLTFGTRVSLALDRASVYLDTIGRQASTAYPLGSSANPAADDVLRDPPFDFLAAVPLAQSHVLFESGTHVLSNSATGVVRLPEQGTVSVTYQRLDTLDHTTGVGDANLSSELFIAGYSIAINEQIALGIGVDFSISELDINDTVRVLPSPAPRFARSIKTDSTTAGPTLGVLYQIDDHWSLGFSGKMTWTDAESKIIVGPTITQFDDTIESIDVRGGVGFQVENVWGVYADVQYRRLSGFRDSAGAIDSVELGRLFVGAEHVLTKGIIGRVGGSVDTGGRATVSTSAGVMLSDWIAMDVAYEYNAFPEVRDELGTGHLVAFSVVVIIR